MARGKTEAPALPLDQNRPGIALLGVPFPPFTSVEALAEIESMVRSGQPHYAVTANVDFLVQARKDGELRRILAQADLCLCDGMPLVWASRWLGNPLPERVAGADLVPKLLEIAAAKNYRPFFLGGKPEVTERAVAKLQKRFPRLQIAGHFSPPFRSLDEMPNEEIVQRIREARPDIVFVSFGCPKAEKWMAKHYQTLGVPLLIGVGGTIDFLAGQLKRAPQWMQDSGLEWLFRLLQEPRRLARRYGSDLWVFSRAIAQQWWRLQFCKRRSRPTPPGSAVIAEPTWRRLRVPERFDRETVSRAPLLWEDTCCRHCLVELGNVKFIDSTAIALLLRLEKKLRRGNQCLVLLEPSEEVCQALRWMGIQSFFLVATDILEARDLVRTPARKADAFTDWSAFLPRAA